MGYTTQKVAPMSTIHPSKRKKLSSEPSTSQAASFDFTESEESIDDELESEKSMDDELDPEAVNEEIPPRKRHSAKLGSKLVSKDCLSTRKASRVLKSVSEDGFNVPTPTQSGVWRRTIKDAEREKSHLKEIISEENFCLHFDGKRLEGKEYQVVCLKNNSRTLQLGILACSGGSAADIYVPLVALIDEFSAWKSIKMIVSDTTAVNTGRKGGIVVKLQRAFQEKGFDEPQFIGCQHHIVDLVLRHVMDFFFPMKTTSPDINYKFIDEIINHYDELQSSYLGKAVVPKRENLGWRDDFKFLFELCEAYKCYIKEGKWPDIKWHKLPSLHSARWNSRGIYALIASFFFQNGVTG